MHCPFGPPTGPRPEAGSSSPSTGYIPASAPTRHRQDPLALAERTGTIGVLEMYSPPSLASRPWKSSVACKSATLIDPAKRISACFKNQPKQYRVGRAEKRKWSEHSMARDMRRSPLWDNAVVSGTDNCVWARVPYSRRRQSAQSHSDRRSENLGQAHFCQPSGVAPRGARLRVQP